MLRARKKADLTNRNHQLIIAGLAGLIDEGMTFHEVMETLEDIKNDVAPGLMEMSREVKG